MQNTNVSRSRIYMLTSTSALFIINQATLLENGEGTVRDRHDLVVNEKSPEMVP